jgi:hypothetical protein
MIPALALTLALLTEPAPGDALRLAPDPVAPAPPAGVVAAVAPPAPARSLAGAVAGALAGLAAGVVALAASTWAARREEELAVAGSGEPLVVFVSGHGSGSAPGVFAHLATLMGIHSTEARYFDYRWADGGADHTQASQEATIDELADALGGYVAGLAALGRPMYLVGFSKGGAGIAELVARWDGGQPGGERVQGAALLDPPMASGVHGFLQSLGTMWGPFPDDGGYNPVRCVLWECADSRDQLGVASGVQVMVVRNPQSGVANFADLPEGLRVYEAADGGPGLLETLFTRPWAIAGRISAAHNSVLHDPRVADCIVAEMRQAGACPLPQTAPAGGVPSWLDGSLPDTPRQALPATGVGTSLRVPSIV